jgi:hypothetical protein
MSFLPLGGTDAASYEEIEQWLAASGHSVELNFNPELRAFRFWGTAATQDLGLRTPGIKGATDRPVAPD